MVLAESDSQITVKLCYRTTIIQLDRIGVSWELLHQCGRLWSPLLLLTDYITLHIYDRKREKLHFFDRTFHHLLFCQTPNFLNVLSKMLFCQNKANNVLSKFIKILSNSDGYLDSLLFCQSLQSCLTEQF